MRTLISLLLALLLAQPVEAAITAETAAASSIANNTTLTFSCNAGSAANRALYLFIGQRSVSYSSVTYNSVAMTQISADTTTGSVSFHVYRLVNPTSGSNTVSIVLNSAPSQLAAICVPLAGVDQTTPEGAVTKPNGNGGTITGSVTSSSDGLVLGGMYGEMSAAGSVTENQTLAAELENLFTNARTIAAAYTAGDGGSKTISWSQTNVGIWKEALFNVNAASATSAYRPKRARVFP